MLISVYMFVCVNVYIRIFDFVHPKSNWPGALYRNPSRSSALPNIALHLYYMCIYMYIYVHVTTHCNTLQHKTATRTRDDPVLKSIRCRWSKSRACLCVCMCLCACIYVCLYACLYVCMCRKSLIELDKVAILKTF